MRTHIDTGKEGEMLAAEWVRLNGFRILERNWRNRRLELDIIAEKEGILHIIEVKTKRSLHSGHPEENAGRCKLRRLIRAAEAFHQRHPEWQRISIDILAISILPGGDAEFFWIGDVYA
jgi:putative endonuclease